MNIFQCTVLYDGWQMQCCGTPFKIGDQVKWLVMNADEITLNIPDISFKIDYYYEAHSSDNEKLFQFSGHVNQILALYEKYAPSPDNKRMLVPISSIMTEVTSADGWDKPINDYEFAAYIVTLDNINIRPAKKAEVPFC